MALTTAYLITTKNLEAFLNAIRSAKAPEQFTTRFLVQLEFKSTNDRLLIGVLKGLKFLDDSGAPTQRYYDYLDQTRSGKVLAEAIEEAYENLFRVNVKAYELSVEEVKNKLKTLTQGQKSDNVVGLMAITFKALCEQADWSKVPKVQKTMSSPPLDQGPTTPLPISAKHEPAAPESIDKHSKRVLGATLHYNIQIILPDTRDPAVFDAICRSLKEHLL